MFYRNRHISKLCTRTEVDSSRRMAWAFTSLSTLGVWRYRIERRRSKLSTFSFGILKTKTSYAYYLKLNMNKPYIYEEWGMFLIFDQLDQNKTIFSPTHHG